MLSGEMFVCKRIPNVCLSWECCVNSRLITNAAKSEGTMPTERRNKIKKKKPDFSKIHQKEGKLLRDKLLKVRSYTLNIFINVSI